MPTLMVKGWILCTLLGFKDPKNLDNNVNSVKLKLLKLNFKNVKYLITDEVFMIMARLLIVLDTHLCLITNYDTRFERFSIILSSNFMQLPLSDDILAKVILQCKIHDKLTDTNYSSYGTL